MGKGLRYCVDDWEGAGGGKRRGKSVDNHERLHFSQRGLIFIRTLSGRLGLLNGEARGMRDNVVCPQEG